MKLIFDQNISHKVLQYLPKEFFGSTSVKQEGLIKQGNYFNRNRLDAILDQLDKNYN